MLVLLTRMIAFKNLSVPLVVIYNLNHLIAKLIWVSWIFILDFPFLLLKYIFLLSFFEIIILNICYYRPIFISKFICIDCRKINLVIHLWNISYIFHYFLCFSLFLSFFMSWIEVVNNLGGNELKEFFVIFIQ